MRKPSRIGTCEDKPDRPAYVCTNSSRSRTLYGPSHRQQLFNVQRELVLVLLDEASDVVRHLARVVRDDETLWHAARTGRGGVTTTSGTGLREARGRVVRGGRALGFRPEVGALAGPCAIMRSVAGPCAVVRSAAAIYVRAALSAPRDTLSADFLGRMYALCFFGSLKTPL